VHTRTGRNRGGELPGSHAGVGSGGHGDVLRGSRGDAAGIELGSSFVERITVNAGTARFCLTVVYPAWLVGLGSSSTDRIGAGRSRRSTPSRGKPVHMGKDGSGYEKGRKL
jgi:hypothetical protein